MADISVDMPDIPTLADGSNLKNSEKGFHHEEELDRYVSNNGSRKT